MTTNGEPLWRLGRSYSIHVYEVGPTSPDGDRPVATFQTSYDARTAVADHNARVLGAKP